MIKKTLNTLAKEKGTFVVECAINLICQNGISTMKSVESVNELKKQVDRQNNFQLVSPNTQIEIIETANYIAINYSLFDIINYIRVYSIGNTNACDKISKERMYELLCGLINTQFDFVNTKNSIIRDKLVDVVGFTDDEINRLGYEFEV